MLPRLLKEGKKNRALLALRSRNHYSTLLEQCEGHLLQINQLISNIEIASLQNEVVAVLETGTLALKVLQKEISIDYVERLLQENADATDAVKEVGELLASAGETTVDGNLLQSELKRLEEEVAFEKSDAMANAPTALPVSSIHVVDAPPTTSHEFEIAR